MKRFLCRLVFVGMIVGGAGKAEAQPNYVYTQLDVSGAVNTEAFGINNNGEIVGYYEQSLGPSHGFLLSGGRVRTINAPGQFLATVLRSINDSGQIVGWDYVNAPGYEKAPNAAFLLSNGTFSSIKPDIPGQPVFFVYPSGINNAGDIVGNYTHYYRDQDYGFLRSGGKYTALDVPGSVRESTTAYGINNAGDILVSSSRGAGLYQPSSGTYTDLNGLVLGPYYNLNGLNDADQIVGAYLDTRNIEHGFVFRDGVLTNVDVPRSKYTWAYGINDAGQIVGTYEAADGTCHGFLATPVPEPSTLLLLGIGALGVIGSAWWRRRRTVLTNLQCCPIAVYLTNSWIGFGQPR